MVSFQFEVESWKDPPWIVFPSVLPDEMWLRPDAWNAYSREWTDWFCSLPRAERLAYERHFPEPASYEDVYRFILNEPR